MIRHPAKFTDSFIPIFADILKGRRNILDPMAGVGKIAGIRDYGFNGHIWCNDLEPEWLNQAPLGVSKTFDDARRLCFADEIFDAVATSPCLAHGQRILRSDLRWIPVEQFKAGDKIIAFDEFPQIKSNGQTSRRKWRIATVLRSVPKRVECVRVHLSNGESIVCTPEHPWLAQRYRSGGNQRVGGYAQWVQTKDLISSETYTRRVHGKWMDISKKSTGWWVYKQLDTWEDDNSYEAGWLSGMFDGEGSLSFGVRGAPKLVITQVDGEIFELAKTRMNAVGLEFSTIRRTDVLPHRKPMSNLYVSGGFPGVLKALGRLRPTRLLSKLDKLDLASRCIQAVQKVQVVGVESVGFRDIQEIETSTGTYIGEGYLMHNCYGNRMADHHEAKDSSRRNTYRHALGRPLSEGNTGTLQWGEEYRESHRAIWTECRRVLKPDGLLVINIKDHIRKGEVIAVTDWHVETILSLGFTLVEHRRVEVRGNRQGENGEARVPYESIITFKKEGES